MQAESGAGWGGCLRKFVLPQEKYTVDSLGQQHTSREKHDLASVFTEVMAEHERQNVF